MITEMYGVSGGVTSYSRGCKNGTNLIKKDDDPRTATLHTTYDQVMHFPQMQGQWYR